MLTTQRPTKHELLVEYRGVLAQELLHLVKTEPRNIEKMDPVRLKLQAVMFHLRKPSK